MDSGIAGLSLDLEQIDHTHTRLLTRTCATYSALPVVISYQAVTQASLVNLGNRAVSVRPCFHSLLLPDSGESPGCIPGLGRRQNPYVCPLARIDRRIALWGDGTPLRAMTLPYPPPFQDLRTLSEHICAAESTIENWVRQGLFPAPRKIGGKNLWRWKEVERYLAHANDLAASLPQDETRRITDATRAAASEHH